MHIDGYLRFHPLDLQALLSILFALALALKVLSTLCGLLNRFKPFLPRRVERLIWWTSKVSAMGICLPLLGLCWLADDKPGLLLWGSLSTLALALILILVTRRLHGTN